MAGKTLGIGLVGAGVIARVHALALAVLPRIHPDAPRTRSVAVADVEPQRAAQFAADHGCERWGDDWRAVVEADDVDLVAVCLPPAYAPEVVVHAARCGKHVLCEKPLAEGPASARRMLAAVEEAGVVHQLGTAYRWAPALRAMRELLDRGEIGAIRHARATFQLDYATDPQLPLLWRYRRAPSGGGAVADTGTHLIDSLRYLVGEIETVQALTRTFIPERPLPTAEVWTEARAATAAADRPVGPVEVEDCGAALLHFAGGGYGVMETSRVATGRKLAMRLELYGEHGALDWDLERIDEFGFYRREDPYVSGFRRVMVTSQHPGARELLIGVGDATGMGWLNCTIPMWRQLLAAVSDGGRASADFLDGVRACEAVAAVYESARTGQPVRVGDAEGDALWAAAATDPATTSG